MFTVKGARQSSLNSELSVKSAEGLSARNPLTVSSLLRELQIHTGKAPLTLTSLLRYPREALPPLRLTVSSLLRELQKHTGEAPLTLTSLLRSPRETPGSAQAELAGLVNRFAARRFAFRFAFASLRFRFASLFASLRSRFASLRFSNRTESNLEPHTPTGRRIVSILSCW